MTIALIAFLTAYALPPADSQKIIETAISFSQEIDPAVSPEKVKNRIKQMAEELRPALALEKDPEKIVELLRYFVYEKWGFHVQPVEGVRPETGYYDTLIRLSQESPQEIYQNSFLVPVLEKKQGNCMGLTSVYLALAEELNLPIQPVVVPYHIFPRYDDGSVRINIETTADGIILSDSFYQRICRISDETVKKGVYLKTLSSRDLFSAYYLALGSYYSAKGLYKKARHAFQSALEASSQLTLAYSNLAFIYSYYGTSSAWSGQARSALKIDPDFLGGYLSLSEAYAREGNMTSAIETLKEAVQKHPDVAFAHAVLGEFYMMEGEFKEAIRSLWRAIEIADWVPDFYVSLAKVYFYKKDFARAWKYANKAKRLGLKNPTILYLLKRESPDPGTYPPDE